MSTPDSRMIDHAITSVAGLWQSNAHSSALRRCSDFLERYGQEQVRLRLLRAEILSSMGRHDEATAETATIPLLQLKIGERARLRRVEALAAVDRGEPDTAGRLLAAAQQDFLSIGDHYSAARIDDDRHAVAVWQGDPVAIATRLAASARTPADRLLLAEAYKNSLRYEEALGVVRKLANEDDLDPSLRAHVLLEVLFLLRLTRQHDKAERLFPELAKAVEAAEDPALTDAVATLSKENGPATTVRRFDRAVQHARRLVTDSRLDDAEGALSALREQARTPHAISAWHLAAGELALARPADAATVHTALEHLEKVTGNATTAALTEVRVQALRLRGTAYYRLDDTERAMSSWHESYALEEQIAEFQVTDEIRVGMLAAAPTEHDMMVGAAAARADHHPEAVAAVVVAMENARGATIMSRLLPEEEQTGLARRLPSPTDLTAARQWVEDLVQTLPTDQIFWVIHSTKDRTHHAFVGHDVLHHTSVPTGRHELEQAVEELVNWRSTPEILDAAIETGTFTRCVNDIAELTGVRDVLTERLAGVTRIAVVAGGPFADVPFAAMTVDGTTELLGHRFALSHLPCLSVRHTLYRRSLQQRGDRVLLVRPPEGLTRATGIPDRDCLADEKATTAGLRATLARRRHRTVRIDTHGVYDEDDPNSSWLELADDRLTADQLREMDLNGCGTVVLGACWSGMAEHRGRDEPMGFVRAAMIAGSASVLAARWPAHDAVAAAVLDRFGRYARYLPRDVALQRAQLALCRGAAGTPTHVPFYGHTGLWACWALHGDAGYQTRAGVVRRRLREKVDERRDHAR